MLEHIRNCPVHTEYFTCDCLHFGDTVRVLYMPSTDKDWEDSLYIEGLMDKNIPWYERIWKAIKYVFGFDENYCFCCCIQREDKKRLIDIIDMLETEEDELNRDKVGGTDD